MVTVNVKPEIIKWAVNRMGGLELLEEKFPKLHEWLNMESQPTFKQLEKFAKATATPLGYFFLSEPPEEKIKVHHFRTVGNQNRVHQSVDLIETLHIMEKRQNWMREYLIDSGNDPLPFVGSANISDDTKKVAKNMREILGLKNGWASIHKTWQEALSSLMVKFEDIGIMVMVNGIVGNNTHRKLEVTEFRGFVLVDEYAPLVFINGADGKAAQMFTLAHELAHIWYGVSAIFDLDNLQPSDEKIEKKCDQTAAEFLLPEEELRDYWPRVKNNTHRYQEIARFFKVSELVVARRVYDLNLITKDEYFSFYKERERMGRDKAKKSGGGNYYYNQTLRIGRHFADAVISSTKEGKLLYQEAYRLTGLNRNTFEKFAKFKERGELNDKG